MTTTTLNAFAPLGLTRGELERMGSGGGGNVHGALFGAMGECNPGHRTRKASYHAMDRILHSGAIDLERRCGAYARVVARCAPALAVMAEFGPMATIDGDGVTAPVDSVANPCVERTRQSSSDSSKRERVAAVKYTGTSLVCAAGGCGKSVPPRLEPHSACGGVDTLEGSGHVGEAVRLEGSGIQAPQTGYRGGSQVGVPADSPERECRQWGPEGRTCMAINVFDGGSHSQGPFRARGGGRSPSL